MISTLRAMGLTSRGMAVSQMKEQSTWTSHPIARTSAIMAKNEFILRKTRGKQISENPKKREFSAVN
ncbi:MAG: hypothetical protein NTW19_17220 [Planctomycetota bacterium]|nr:hypothetical protein [Planctomycetota bacterium]